jgi:hypothetical protein
MAKEQVAKSEPQKAPYATPRIFKLERKLISNDITDIGWVGYLGIVIGSILGYFLAVLI